MENSSNMEKSSSKNLPASKVKAPAAKRANNKVFKKMATGNTKKMSLAKTPAKKQASALKKSTGSKKVATGNTKKMPLAKTPAKKQNTALKKSTSSSGKGMKTRADSNRASLDSLMAGFQIEGRAKTALGMPLKDFSESAVSLLLSNYKVENEKVLSTTALAM